MGERRQPRRTILIRQGNTTLKKIEIFEGSLFPGKTFTDIMGEPLKETDRSLLSRLRVNGKWFPARRKILFQRHELNEALFRLIGE